MAINVTGNNLNQTQKTTSGNRPVKAVPNVAQQSGDNRPTSKTTPKTDSITLTESAANFKKLEESIAHLPIVDMQKVEEIQKAIADGSYKIDADKIAEKFIDMELALNR